MEQTTHYQLNQWAGEDRIMRLDFNADNAKLDAALYQLSQTQSAHAAALEAEQQARAAQDTAVRQEFAAGDAAERQTAAAEAAAVQQSLNAQAAAIRQEFAAGDAAVAAANPLVKLAHIVTEQSATQIDIDIGNYWSSDYMELIILPDLDTDSTAVYTRINSISSDSYSNNNRVEHTYLATVLPRSSGWVQPLCVAVTNKVTCYSRENQQYHGISPLLVPLDGPIILNFVPNSSGCTLSAGSEIRIYGVRK